MGPEELRMTRQIKVSTELQEGQEEAGPGQHQGQLSVAHGAQRPSEISHSLICSFIPQIDSEHLWYVGISSVYSYLFLTLL